MRADGQTDMSKLIFAFRNLTHLKRATFVHFLPNTENVNNTNKKFRGNSPVRSRSKPGGQQAKK